MLKIKDTGFRRFRLSQLLTACTPFVLSLNIGICGSRRFIWCGLEHQSISRSASASSSVTYGGITGVWRITCLTRCLGCLGGRLVSRNTLGSVWIAHESHMIHIQHPTPWGESLQGWKCWSKPCMIIIMVDSFNQGKRVLPNVDTDHIIIVSPYPTVYKRSRGLTVAHEVMFSPLHVWPI